MISNVAKIFNDMRDDYDDLKDPWYSWLMSRLHYLIVKTIIMKNIPDKVLDIGCGTGFQSFIYAAAGNEVIGIDIAEDLINIAKKKLKNFNFKTFELFPAYYDYVRKYNQIILKGVNKSRGLKEFKPPKFFVGDAINIPYQDNYFDHVNCCGSVLSFIPNYKKAISELARVLKSKGTFFIETEARWNFDAFWYFIDPFLRGKIGINDSLKKSYQILIQKPLNPIWINFSFGESNKPIDMKINLFTYYTLKKEFFKHNLKIEKKWSIHSITNLIPSVYLDALNPSNKLIKYFKLFAKIEENLPFYFPGCSIVLYGRKK